MKISSRHRITLRYVLYPLFLLSGSVIVIFALVSGRLVLSSRQTTVQSNTTQPNSQTELAEANADETETDPKIPTICLDPGHGGKDIGASYGKIYESDINLTVALKTKTLLEAAGYNTVLTRTTDDFIPKRDRAVFCNQHNASILVIIHHNAYSQDPSVNYSTALYYKKSDQALATSLLNSLSNQLEVKNQGIAKFDNSELYIATMPAALTEAFFITSTKEYRSLTNKTGTLLDDEAQAITDGIINYFDNPNQTINVTDPNSLIIDRNDYD